MGYIVYACNQNGEGFTQKIGTFQSLDEIRLRVGLFASDVVLEIEETPAQEARKPVPTATATPAPAISTATIPDLKLK